MTARTLYIYMSSREREVGVIMIKISRLPCGLAMTSRTLRGISRCYVIRIGGGIIIIDVTASTGIWRIRIVSIVAAGTIVRYRCMCPLQYIIVIVHRKGGWTPAGIGGMTSSTVIAKAQGCMIRIGCLVKVGRVAIDT
jgi:hypothetical protein